MGPAGPLIHGLFGGRSWARGGMQLLTGRGGRGAAARTGHYDAVGGYPVHDAPAGRRVALGGSTRLAVRAGTLSTTLAS